jgi:hypothetical protein
MRKIRMNDNKNVTKLLFDDFMRCETKADYIKEFNELFEDYTAFNCEIVEEYTDKNGCELTVINFLATEK